MQKKIVMTFLGLLISVTPAYAFLPNGDFEVGDLSDYSVQEDFVDVPSSALVKNVALSPNEHVAEINAGFSSHGITTSSLIRDFGTLPVDVQDVFFDVKFIDVGEDNPPIFALGSSPELLALDLIDADILLVSFGSSEQNISEVFSISATGFANSPETEVKSLSNGFYRVKTSLSGFGATNNNKLYFDLRDGDDLRLSKVQIDNIDLTAANQAVAPEPASMLLIGSGLLGFGFLRKKKLV